MNWTEALGLTLLHFLWQGLVIGLLAAAATYLLRGAGANARYLAACVAMAAMGLAAVGTFLWMIQPETLAEGARGGQFVAADLSAAAVVSEPSPNVSLLVGRLLPWLDFLWFSGVFALALRSALSWLAARRLSRTGITAAPAEWQQRASRLMRRLAIRQPVRLCESVIAEVPSVVGWLKPVILIPAGTLAGLSAEQLESILAHELAHVRRHDYLVNLLQTAVETLLFYHPAVWWVGARMRAERENCCDDLAVEACGDALVYARALANLEQLRQAGPRLALAATDGGLLSRISRLLGQAPVAVQDSRSYWLPSFIMLMVAAVGLVAQQRAPLPPAPALAPVADVGELSAPPAIVAVPPEAPEAPPQPPAGPDFIETMEKAGLKGLTVDQLIALKVHDVTPEFIQQSKAMGFNLTLDQLMAFRIHGVTAEVLREWKGRGFNLSADQMVAFQIHGVTAEAVEQMKALGFSLTADEAVAMRIHEVTPEFVKAWRDAGFKDLRFDSLVALRVQGAQPGMVQELKSLGFANPTVDELLQARIFGITQEFVQAVRKRGFKDLTFQQVVRLKQMDIIR